MPCAWSQLLTKDPECRLSSLADIQSSPYLADVNWDAVLEKAVTPGFVPNVSRYSRWTVFANSDFNYHCRFTCLRLHVLLFNDLLLTEALLWILLSFIQSQLRENLAHFIRSQQNLINLGSLFVPFQIKKKHFPDFAFQLLEQMIVRVNSEPKNTKKIVAALKVRHLSNICKTF